MSENHISRLDILPEYITPVLGTAELGIADLIRDAAYEGVGGALPQENIYIHQREFYANRKGYKVPGYAYSLVLETDDGEVLYGLDWEIATLAPSWSDMPPSVSFTPLHQVPGVCREILWEAVRFAQMEIIDALVPEYATIVEDF